jgi:hypothetical protein
MLESKEKNSRMRLWSRGEAVGKPHDGEQAASRTSRASKITDGEFLMTKEGVLDHKLPMGNFRRDFSRYFLIYYRPVIHSNGHSARRSAVRRVTDFTSMTSFSAKLCPLRVREGEISLAALSKASGIFAARDRAVDWRNFAPISI